MSNRLPLFFIIALAFLSCNKIQINSQANGLKDSVASKENCIPLFAQCLMEAYPDQIIGIKDNAIIWHDSTSFPYDDRIEKSVEEMLDNADIEDMSHWIYSDHTDIHNDAGRIRNEPFFKKMYGCNKSEMMQKTTTIVWCPQTVNQRLRITTVNGVDKQLKKVSDELDRHPEWIQFISGPSTINWRVVAGTHRLSPHSYGIAIDIGVPQSNYWKWDYPNAKETDKIGYKNRFPIELVEIFEKHGFIWGGRWTHYDNMHFEYRPEILLYKKKKEGK